MQNWHAAPFGNPQSHLLNPKSKICFLLAAFAPFVCFARNSLLWDTIEFNLRADVLAGRAPEPVVNLTSPVLDVGSRNATNASLYHWLCPALVSGNRILRRGDVGSEGQRDQS